MSPTAYMVLGIFVMDIRRLEGGDCDVVPAMIFLKMDSNKTCPGVSKVIQLHRLPVRPSLSMVLVAKLAVTSI